MPGALSRRDALRASASLSRALLSLLIISLEAFGLCFVSRAVLLIKAISEVVLYWRHNYLSSRPHVTLLGPRTVETVE